jgi:hypothetical protein
MKRIKMKKLILLSIFFCINIKAFDFIDHKEQGVLSKDFLQELIKVFSPKVFFETGTYYGGTTISALPYFKEIYTVELHKGLFENARKLLKKYNNVHVYNDRSYEVILKVAPNINGTILFWLDAHFSGEDTALSFNNPEAPEAVTAIREELRAIKEIRLNDCIILIDDIRGFGVEVLKNEYLGCWAYPTIQEVQHLLQKINPRFEVVLLGDILLAYDGSKYNPSFSEAVVACTKTRLYDGYNLNDDELIELEKTIMNAPAYEKDYIKNLYSRMTDYKDPMFWHDLWCGLVELGSQNYMKAYEAFSKVKIREQHYNKNRKLDPKKIPYEHWRIDKYMEECLKNK